MDLVFHEKSCTNYIRLFSLALSWTGGQVPEKQLSSPWILQINLRGWQLQGCAQDRRGHLAGGEHTVQCPHGELQNVRGINWPFAAPRPFPRGQFAGMNYLTLKARIALIVIGWSKDINWYAFVFKLLGQLHCKVSSQSQQYMLHIHRNCIGFHLWRITKPWCVKLSS